MVIYHSYNKRLEIHERFHNSLLPQVGTSLESYVHICVFSLRSCTACMYMLWFDFLFWFNFFLNQFKFFKLG